MVTSAPKLIPARKGVAEKVTAGECVRVVNTYGQQVVDMWAFAAEDATEFMSMEHTRASIMRLTPRVGDQLRTNRRRPILKLVEDTTPGAHDTLIAACDVYRYESLGHKGYHANCTENLHGALGSLGITAPDTPSPLNLFMNVPMTQDMELSFVAPSSKPGQYVTFLVELDCVVVFSACPQDLVPVNGAACTPTDAHYQVLEGGPRA
jgi:uncharacterized protein YcgI (DUF1989 family)